MEAWFAKSILATVSIVPTFIAIPFMKFRYGVDPLVFLAWYFGATAISIACYLVLSGRGAELVPPVPVLVAILLIGVVFGACLLYTSPSPRDLSTSRMPSSA